MINKVYFLLGSNIGNSQLHLESAIRHIKKRIGEIKRLSKIYKTKAWGNTKQDDFLNQIIIIETTLSASEILNQILNIENKMGRSRTKKNEPRIIDIDILFFNKESVNTTNLHIPHPLIQERNFVLVPLNELSPQFKHPILNKTIHQLLRVCKDKLNVKKIL